MKLLVYPDIFNAILRPMSLSLLFTALVFSLISLINFRLSVTWYLLLAGSILALEISYLNYVYYSKLLREGVDPSEV